MVQTDTAILNRIFGPDSHFSMFLSQYKVAIAAVLAFVTMASFVFLTMNITKLATSQSDPRRRKDALVGIGISGCCIAVLGSLDIFFVLVLSLI